MLRVVISGATGAVGRALVPAVEAEPDLELAARAAPSLGVTLADALAGGAPTSRSTSACPPPPRHACEAAIAARVPLVIGTTGLTPDDRPSGGREGRRGRRPHPRSRANFAIGAVLLMRFAEQARPHMDAVEIIELHADTKRDAPSGTALATAARLGGDVPIHSVRLPGLVAHQEVILGAPARRSRCATTPPRARRSSPASLLAIRRVGGLAPGLTSGLEALL